jgi:hypothetical protein
MVFGSDSGGFNKILCFFKVLILGDSNTLIFLRRLKAYGFGDSKTLIFLSKGSDSEEFKSIDLPASGGFTNIDFSCVIEGT